MSAEIRNAKISATHLGNEDHGIFTAYLTLDYGGASQGFGGYAIEAWAGRFIKAVLSTLEVESWEKLPGTVCRIRRANGSVEAIGHFLKDQWFDPSERTPGGGR